MFLFLRDYFKERVEPPITQGRPWLEACLFTLTVCQFPPFCRKLPMSIELNNFQYGLRDFYSFEPSFTYRNRQDKIQYNSKINKFEINLIKNK